MRSGRHAGWVVILAASDDIVNYDVTSCFYGEKRNTKEKTG